MDIPANVECKHHIQCMKKLYVVYSPEATILEFDYLKNICFVQWQQHP